MRPLPDVVVVYTDGVAHVMMIRTSLPVIFTLLLLSLSGCRDEPAVRDATDTTAGVYDMTFPQPKFAGGRMLDTIMNVDLDNDGRLEYIVTSIQKDGFAPSTARADHIALYRFDTLAKQFVTVSDDSLMWITELRLRDVTGDRLPDLVVNVDAGGNDLTASAGLYIYSGDGGKVRTIFHADNGDPQLATLEGIHGDAVLLHDELWPDFASHAEAAPYVADILVYKGNSFVSARREHERYFMQEADRYLTEYRTARGEAPPTESGSDAPTFDSVTTTYEMRLFTPAALALIAFGHADNGRALRSFWDSERDYLQSRLSPPQFAALDSMYASTVLQ